MNIQHVSVSLSINVDLCDLPEGITLEQIATQMNRDQWDEGRYPFDAEMIHEGLSQQIERAVREATIEAAMKEHGKQRIETPNGSIMLGYFKAEEAMKPFSVYIVDSIKAAEITPCST